ncbi:winged helix-turn-helix domain-containing protein [Enterococcus wangshanyuanii]|uniref:OmpR/PhoB-type domain-containing protein n=1 Tax=Enterococcus wangshanyuanii TaxID=2005703 RepID=A0ABQ1PTH3_9ENTE|nr:winged helix-turn-helix domain-containing protein [Enterococcus wangshanyuanii]GGD03022.1 hypothetical protein GCM10011573_35630 [Enterococcus wangshanyuanii]
MNKIGMIYLDELDKSDKMDIFDRNVCEVVEIPLHEVDEYASIVDGIVICDRTSDSKAGICNIVIRIKESGISLPIWILSRDMESSDRILLLNLGASGVFGEDKQCLEIRLTIQNTLISRQELRKESPERKKCVQNEVSSDEKYIIDEGNRSIIFPGYDEILLTALEYRIVSLLHKNKGNTVPYNQIFTAVWGARADEDASFVRARIANLIHHIRKKYSTRDLPIFFDLKTIRSKGYIFVEYL